MTEKMENRSTTQILSDLQDTLDMALRSYNRLKTGSQEERAVELKNFIINGRSVTFVLQNLKSNEKDFEEWYKKYQDEMSSDPLLSYFNTCRVNIIHKGSFRTGKIFHINNLCIPQDIPKIKGNPQNAKSYSFFPCDELGRSGWVIELNDGAKD
jgi:hypothetical protein